MSYLVNSTRLSSLTIDGVDYTSSMISWIASDSSSYKNGCITTTGTVVLGRRTGSSSIEDYDRNAFKRGAPVILDVTYPDGTTARHPRGLLYVITNSYDAESDAIEVEIGCRLALMNLTDEIDELLAISPLTLDTAQETFSNISAAFTSLGQVCYQDNQGNLQTKDFFSGDSLAGVASGDWVSIGGITTLSVSPLSGGGAIPDRINIQYQVPRDSIAEDNQGYVETVVDISKYWTQYPAITYNRVLSADTITNGEEYLAYLRAQRTSTTQTASRTSSSCGNEPPRPGGPGLDPVTPIYASCTEQFQALKEQQYISVTRTQTTKTYYDAPGGQVSRIYSEIKGPAVEANNQYYADKYAYCRQLYASQCDPNGNCPMEGQNEILLGYTEQINYYGEANELVESIQDTWATTLSVAKPEDWRAGSEGGVVQQFNGNLSETDQYRASRVKTQYFKEAGANVQVTTTYTSAATRGAGISQGVAALDALNGIVTSNKRISTTTATLEVAPDRVNSATTDTKEETTEIVLFTGRFQEPPAEAGPYIMDEAIPMPLLYDTQAEIETAVAAYENYITRFIKGDAFGLQIGEALRKDIADGWSVGRPFRYYDSANGEVVAMRMDGCSWGIDQEGAAVVIQGVWIGSSNGSVTLPNNLVGNSSPDLGGGGPTPPPAVVPPSVDNETSVDSGALAFIVNVFFGTGATMTPAGNADGVVNVIPTDLSYTLKMGFIASVSGLILEPGGLLDGDGNGGIPLENQGNMVASSATVVNDDLFATV